MYEFPRLGVLHSRFLHQTTSEATGCVPVLSSLSSMQESYRNELCRDMLDPLNRIFIPISDSLMIDDVKTITR